MTDENPFRHPGGRTCAGIVAMWTLLAAVAAMLGRKAGTR
jgi:hypothetical protein